MKQPILRRKSFIFLTALAILLAACNTDSPVTSTNTTLPSPSPQPTNTLPPPTSTPLSSATSTISPTPEPSATSSPEPSPTPTITPSETATPTVVAQQISASTNSGVILKYLIHHGTGGPVGCGDSLVAVSTGRLATGDLAQDITTAVNSLFATGVKKVGDLYNPLYQSKLTVQRIEINKSSGEATLWLTGNFVKPKDSCDKSRYRFQVWQTIYQFSAIKRAHIWVDRGLKLGDLLAND